MLRLSRTFSSLKFTKFNEAKKVEEEQKQEQEPQAQAPATQNDSKSVNIEPRVLQDFLNSNAQLNIVLIATGDENAVSDEDALAKAMKDMGLRKTNAQDIYCELHNPNMPAGNYTKQRHYYWDKTNQKMVELPDVYYVSSDRHQVKDMIDNYNKTGSVNSAETLPETDSKPVVTDAPASAPTPTPAPTPEVEKLPDTPKVEETPEQTPSVEETPEEHAQTKAALGEFDFSVIDGYDNDFSSFYTQPSIENLGSATSKNVIDEGYWDKALEALEKLKPQLHEYIKAQMDSKNLNYNYDTVDKILNTFISEAVTSGLIHANLPLEQDVNNWVECNVPTGNKTCDLKMSSVVNSLLSKVDAELGIDSKYTDFGTKSFPHDAPNAFTEANQLRGLYYSPLMETADKYLSEEDKILKTVLVGLTIDDSIPFGNTYTRTKQTVDKVVEMYSNHVELYLKSKYQTLSDDEISAILNNLKNEISQDSVLENLKNTDGTYDLEAIVKYFGEKAESLANGSHNEGVLFGIKDETEAKKARKDAEEVLRSFNNMTDYKIEQILTTVSSYGDKLNATDLWTITVKLLNYYEDSNVITTSANTFDKEAGLSIMQKDLIKIIDEYLSKKTDETVKKDDDSVQKPLEDNNQMTFESLLRAPSAVPSEDDEDFTIPTILQKAPPSQEELNAIDDVINKKFENMQNIFEY